MIEPENLGMINFETKVLGVYMEMDGKGYHVLRMSDFELMEYTGLKDKNGREICEEHIVDDDLEPMKVVYQDGSFGLKFLNNKEYFDNCVNWECCEIIGNIYENPELLGEETQ
jgi:hypothetical protein